MWPGGVSPRIRGAFRFHQMSCGFLTVLVNCGGSAGEVQDWPPVSLVEIMTNPVHAALNRSIREEPGQDLPDLSSWSIQIHKQRSRHGRTHAWEDLT
jgi:hypothetical protein